MDHPVAIADSSTRNAPKFKTAKPAPLTIIELPTDWQSQWDGYVNCHAEGTFFHTLAWRRAVKEAFKHEDIYLTAFRGERIVGVLPLFLVASRIAGRMLVSVPYGVGGGILADDEGVVCALFEVAKELASRRDCPTIDLRSARAIVPELAIQESHVGFCRELPERSPDVLGWLPRKARAAARNARKKYQLKVTFGDEQLKEVWRLYSISMRRLGSLTYPFAFFEHLVAGTPDRHWVSLVRRDGRSVAGLVTILFGDTVMPYFIGTSDEARRCSAANFIYLTVMERGVASGYRKFDFGRSRLDNSGSCDFKRFNGFSPHPLQYQSYVAPGHSLPDLSPSNPKFRIARRIWTYLPLWMTRSVGAWVAKHIPG